MPRDKKKKKNPKRWKWGFIKGKAKCRNSPVGKNGISELDDFQVVSELVLLRSLQTLFPFGLLSYSLFPLCKLKITSKTDSIV